MSFLSRTVLAPLVPVLAPLVPVIGQRAVLGLSGYVINNIGFVFAAVYLYSCHFEGPRSSSEGFDFVLLQFSFHILFINIFRDIVRPFFSWRIVPSNIWKRCHCCSLVCSFGIFKAVVGGALLCICIFVPFIAFQAYGYNKLCLGHLPSDMRPWCNARVPLLYNYIQSHYWYVIFNHQCLFIRLIPFFQV
nr:uncharacterized protein LOC103415191 isoform X5 [Malus domestica]